MNEWLGFGALPAGWIGKDRTDYDCAAADLYGSAAAFSLIQRL